MSRDSTPRASSFRHSYTGQSIDRSFTLDRACPKEIRAPPLLIGVAGGTASGKTTVCYKISQVMADDRVAIISMDNFYRPLTAEEKASVDGAHCPVKVVHAALI